MRLTFGALINVRTQLICSQNTQLACQAITVTVTWPVLPECTWTGNDCTTENWRTKRDVVRTAQQSAVWYYGNKCVFTILQACLATILVSTPTCIATWLTLRFGFRSHRISIVCLTEKVLKRKVLKPSSLLTASSMFVSASGRDPGASQCLNIQAQSDTNLKTFSPDLIQPEGKLLFITPNVNGAVKTAFGFFFPPIYLVLLERLEGLPPDCTVLFW